MSDFKKGDYVVANKNLGTLSFITKNMIYKVKTVQAHFIEIENIEGIVPCEGVWNKRHFITAVKDTRLAQKMYPDHVIRKGWLYAKKY